MTEFHQPINPMRITWQCGTHNDWVSEKVFAIAISNDHDVEYLTIFGRFMQKDEIRNVEMFVNGQWC